MDMVHGSGVPIAKETTALQYNIMVRSSATDSRQQTSPRLAKHRDATAAD
jgi:hypothetical protein